MIHVASVIFFSLGLGQTEAPYLVECPSNVLSSCTEVPNPCTYTQKKLGECPTDISEICVNISKNNPCHKFCAGCMPYCSPADLEIIFLQSGNKYPSADVIQTEYCLLPNCPEKELDNCRDRRLVPQSCTTNGQANSDFIDCPISCEICVPPKPTPSPTPSPTPRGVRRDKPKSTDWLNTIFIAELSGGLGLFVILCLVVYKKYKKAKANRERKKGKFKPNRY